MPLNLLDLLNRISNPPIPDPEARPPAGSAPPVPGQADVPGAKPGDQSGLGTVLATLRRVGPGPRARAMLGGNQRPAPSKGGAVAQGFMQAMDSANTYDTEQAKLKRLLDAFDYKKAQDALDRQYKVQQDTIRNRQAEERMKIWRENGRGKKPDALLVETRRMKLLAADPDYQRLQADDEEKLTSKKLTPEQRAELEAKVAARRKQIWTLGAEGADDDGEDPTPAPAPAADKMSVYDVTENTVPVPRDVPMPTPRPADLGGQAPAPAPAPAPVPAPAPRPARRTPPAAAVEALRANPDKADEFDAYFGPGSAASVLGLPAPVPNFGGSN